MAALSLRLRIFLFFAALAAGGLLITGLALWVGYRELGQPGVVSPFVVSGAVAAFGIPTLTAGI